MKRPELQSGGGFFLTLPPGDNHVWPIEGLPISKLPKGVINVVTCSRHEAEILLKHPDVKGVSFVGSTAVGLHIYATTAAGHRHRVQALTEARTTMRWCCGTPRSNVRQRGIINSACGSAGERCMALPVVVAEEAIADAAGRPAWCG